LDFLIEALDAWYLAKEKQDPLAPPHDVKLKIVAGTSGGGINAILLARILGYEALPDTPNATRKDRIDHTGLLHEVWVDGIDITKLLQTDDIERGKPVTSLMCAKVLDGIGEYAGTYPEKKHGDKPSPKKRRYVDDSLPVVLTVTNLRGVPYASMFGTLAGRREYYIDRADHLRFRVNVSGELIEKKDDKLRPDETWIDYNTKGVHPFDYQWGPLVEAARATSAFPVGLPPIVVHRDVAQYQYRYAVIHDAPKKGGPKKADDVKHSEIATGGKPRTEEMRAVWMRPDWSYLVPEGCSRDDLYRALCVDGGVFNNEPICFARDELAGILGTNPRGGKDACRAVLLIDPFSDSGEIGPLDDPGMIRTAVVLSGAFTSGARFQTADISLFTDEDVYSRFLITPVRNTEDGRVTGGKAIASSGLGAFMGFMHRDFREHDFQLGRRNCQQFLRAHFTLTHDNPVFDGWNDELKKHYLVRPQGADDVADKAELPIIPLMPSVSEIVRQQEWNADNFDPKNLRSALKKRLKAVVDAEIAFELDGFWPEAAGQIGKWLLSAKGPGWIIGKIEQSLKEQGLRR
jgi:hypothetical protein